MSSTNTNNILDTQPFYVIDNEGYDRMMMKLTTGERYVKSFIGRCPHRNSNNCDCTFFLNFLDEQGNMVRSVGGVIKPVIPVHVLSAMRG